MNVKSIESEGKNNIDKLVQTEELNRIKGHFMKKYGVPVDKFSAIVLQEMYEGFEKVQVEMQKGNSIIEEASQKIKGSVKHISFQNKWAAFWYAIGRGIPYFLTIITIAFLLFSAFIYNKRHEQEKEKKLTKTDQKHPKLTKTNQKKPKLTKHN